MDSNLKADIIKILKYFDAGLSDVKAGSGEDQPMLKEIKTALKRINRIVPDLPFSHEKLTEYFEWIRAGKSNSNSGFDFNYIVSAEKGDIAQITYLGKNEWRFYIDNFPGQKLWYTTNFPITTLRRFIEETEHIGLNLKLKSY